jgi:hypothetical protein
MVHAKGGDWRNSGDERKHERLIWVANNNFYVWRDTVESENRQLAAHLRPDSFTDEAEIKVRERHFYWSFSRIMRQ